LKVRFSSHFQLNSSLSAMTDHSFPTEAPATAELDFSPDEAGGETLPATEHVGWSDGVTEVDDVTLPDAQKPAEAFVATGWPVFPSPDTARRMANAIRVLSMDAIEKARSGHPGMPLGRAANPEALALTWKCSINLAGATMSDDTIADFIREQRANNAIPAAKVVFEITESEAIRNPAAASRLVDDLKAQGFGIALDDFGTGLATFEYLKRFPLDYLKIDGSFVRNLMTNPIDEEIILSTVRVAKRLKLRTVAEHVHNAAIYERLTDLGVSYLQGDFFGKAMPLAEMFERQAPSTAHLRQPPPRPLSGTPLPSAPPPSVGNTVGGASVLH